MAIPGARRRQASSQSVFKGDDASEGRHAIALAKNATAILMDEPTSGLAPQASNEFSQLVKMLGQQRTTVLMATHDLYRAKDIGIMRQGQLVESVKPGDVSHSELEAIALRIMQFQ